MTIYFLVSTSIFTENDIYQYNLRKEYYINGINKLKHVIKIKNIEDYKIIIIENNGLRSTYLDSLECEVYYTNNNFLQNQNKGYKELEDILNCIYHYNINDNDFIVKMTGRYVLDDNSEFMNIIKNINDVKYDCVIKYGSFGNPLNYKCNDCITGLIGMRCMYIKKIEKPAEEECVEWKWAKATYLIDDEKIHMVDKLGIYICPGSNNYYFV